MSTPRTGQKLTVQHRGFTINVTRDRALGGWDNTYFHVLRDSDGRFMVDDFTEGLDSLETIANAMKSRVDDWLDHPEEYVDESDF